jgi:AcrR family transcriptional regulator
MMRVRVAAEQQIHPRERMIRSALLLMGEQGVEATSFSQVIEHSGAPRGSIYHHFPGGKAQLVEEATRFAGDSVVALLEAAEAAHPDDPLAAVDAISGFWRTLLHDSEFAAGCPVVAAMLGAERLPAAREAARDAFERWQRSWVRILTGAGIDRGRARALAALAVSAVEGAVILARAQGSDAPLRRVADELRDLFHRAVEEAAG